MRSGADSSSSFWFLVRSTSVVLRGTFASLQRGLGRRILGQHLTVAIDGSS